MSMCRCAPSACARRSSSRSRGAASRMPALGRLGAQQRRERGDLDREVRARQRAERVRFEARLRLELRVGGRERVERRGAARGVAVGLGGGDGRLAEQVDGRRDAVAPQALEGRQGVRGVRADDEAVRHVLDARGAGGAERGAAGLRVAHLHRRVQRRRLVVDLARGSRSGGSRGRRASGMPGRRRRSERARRAARRRARRDPSRARRAP